MKKVTLKNQSLAVFIVTFMFLSTVLLVITFNTGLNTSQDTINNNFLSSQSSRMDKYPIDYTVVDRYSSGETFVRGTKNSLDSTPLKSIDEDIQQPLSKFSTNLLGGDEMCLLTNWFGGPYGLYVEHYSDSRFLYNSSLEYDLMKGEARITTSFSDKSEFNYGDFDGNFKQDLVVASLMGSRLKLQIVENWGDKGMTLTAETNSSNLWDCNSLSTVTAGDFDGDKLDEFAVLGIKDSIPQLWIFDDIVDSNPQQFVNYGDIVMFKTSQSPNRYLNSENGDLMNSLDIIEKRAVNDISLMFTIQKYNARNHTGVVQYGDDVVFMDFAGNYWTDFDLGKLESRMLPQLIGTPPHEGEQNRFKVLSDRTGNPLVGVVHYNDFVSFQSAKGEYVQNDLNFVSNNNDKQQWFKIVKNDSLPQTFKTVDLIPIETFQHENFKKIDILAPLPSEDPATTSVTSCNIDGDFEKELVLIGMDQSGWARGWVLDDSNHNFDILHEFSWVDQINNVHINVASGNIDEDQQDEIIFSLTKGGFGRVEIYDDGAGSNNFDLLKEFSGDSSLHGDFTQVTTGDIDGDGIDEIIFVKSNSEIIVWDDSTSNFGLISSFNPWADKTGAYIPQDITTGDLDIDGTEEILITSQFTISVLGSTVGVIDYNGTHFNRTNEDRYAGVTTSLKIAAGDFAGDQFTIKYLDHDVYTSDEQVIATMAAPPTQFGISQNYDDSSTAYGEGESTSGGQTWGASASFGAYFGIEIEVSAGFLVSLKIAKVEMEFALVSETSITHTVTQTTAYMATFTTDATYNYVIFSTCLYDRFVYEIMEAPDASIIGKNYSIHIPNEVTVEKWDVNYFNSHNSANAPDIGKETFSHTVGYVTSYPAKEEMDSIAPVRMQTDPISVGKGAATIGQEIDLSTETEVELESSLTFEWKVGAGAGTVTAGLMGSIGVLGGHSWGWGEDTMFSCEIGDIEDDDDYANFRYTCGLFVYIKEYRPKATEDWLSSLGGIASKVWEEVTTLGLDSFSRGEGYYVLNYWVDVPLGWGDGAAEAHDYAEDVDDVIEELITEGIIPSIIFYPAIVALPVANIFFRRQGGKKK